jgi:MYXO-CTERM domain-containing protein
MTRRCSFVLSLAAVLLAAQPALALSAILESIDGDSVDADNYVPLNKEQCDKNAEVRYEVTNDRSANYLAVMKGTDCDQDRTDVTNDNCTKLVGESIEGVNKPKITFSAKDLDCQDTSGPTRKIYFLGLADEGDEKKGSSDAFIDDFKIDTVVPRAPSGVEGGSGEHSIEVSWSFGGTDVEEFRVYYEVVNNCPEDSALCAFSTDDCGSGSSSGAGELDDAGTSEEEDEGQDTSGSEIDYETASASSRSLKLEDKVEVGETAAVAVAAFDEAGNGSLLSNVDCITGISTVGFCEMNEKQGGSCESGCAAAGPGAGGGRGAAAVGLAVLALAVMARRRKV